MNTKVDWSLPIEQLPEEVSFEHLPPIAQALVRRNVLLREKLALCEASLLNVQETVKLLQVAQLQEKNDK